MAFKRVIFYDVELRPDVNAISAEWDDPFDAAVYKQATGSSTGPGVKASCPKCKAVAYSMGQSVSAIRHALFRAYSSCGCHPHTPDTFYTSGDGQDGWEVWSAGERAARIRTLP